MTSRRSPMRRADAPIGFSGALRNQLHQASFFAEMLAPDAPRRVGVVGCHRGAGASTVAYNIASMLQERSSEPTLLVEANLRHPVLTQRWGLGPAGTANRVLASAAQIGAGAVPPTAEGLVVWAANEVPDPLALLRAGLTPLMRETKPFRHVVIDLPPALEYPDVSVLAPALDALILVLEVEQTRWQVAKLACQQFENAGLRVLGAVLNKKPMYIPAWLYRLL